MVYSDKVTTFSLSPYYSINEEMNMGDKNLYSSFNLVFGISVSNFDWFDNPYISATVYD